MEENINLERKDIVWTYVSMFIQLSNNIILLPLILKIFSREEIGIWIIFSTIMGLTNLLDFGFNTSFMRSVSYVFSGTKTLQKTGFSFIKTSEIDYSLLKGLINSMKWVYSRIAFVLLFLLLTVGSYYMYALIKNYSENHIYIYISWSIISIFTSYSFYTLYYDALLLGKGSIKCNKQIMIIGQFVYLVVVIILIIVHYNLLAIIIAKFLSLIIVRFLSHRSVYTEDFKCKLKKVIPQSHKKIIKSIYPNAIKTGLISFGGVLINQFVILIGPYYFSLEEIGSYGITIQIIGAIASLANVYHIIYQPQIVQYRLNNDKNSIKYIYLRGILISFLIFTVCGSILLIFGNRILYFIESKTPLLSNLFIVFTLFISFFETNYINAAGIILTKNEVPFFKASLFSFVAIFILLFLFFQYTSIGIWGMVIARAIVQGAYQIWKWPVEVIKELKIRKCDFYKLYNVY
ncbi:MAG: hypothetical protein LBC54_03095 [Bacteroidales bacterium OttesenSCG-928-I14]|jgi:O-antigen/teichoic acid export membrane protein|nr:hypothetical protein [Bacteroidales bacterium OttesenSCG-928-I14]